ncbi:hypothetical protein NEOLEDRAFT_707462 [Neolentinus lepideus HHB14362 ss-1]|uniref:Uncharacterized protein n=1 Tax=Neolentinus lepideus HHB14362 ss-1 TaxID=1314782 RepID=A0A165Q6R2_9AGAM|nr:hypothetical protein NEOLEDRAFT_707462 [Neolentinus lepideus HHB14362 ss-1]
MLAMTAVDAFRCLPLGSASLLPRHVSFKSLFSSYLTLNLRRSLDMSPLAYSEGSAAESCTYLLPSIQPDPKILGIPCGPGGTTVDLAEP